MTRNLLQMRAGVPILLAALAPLAAGFAPACIATRSRHPALSSSTVPLLASPFGHAAAPRATVRMGLLAPVRSLVQKKAGLLFTAAVAVAVWKRREAAGEAGSAAASSAPAPASKSDEGKWLKSALQVVEKEAEKKAEKKAEKMKAAPPPPPPKSAPAQPKAPAATVGLPKVPLPEPGPFADLPATSVNNGCYPFG